MKETTTGSQGFDLVLFDLDGTLADTLADIAHAMNHCLGLHGLPAHGEDAYRMMIGDGVAQLALRSIPPESAELHEEVVACFREYYTLHLLDKTTPYPGIPELLDGITRLGVPMAILSNKPDQMTRQIMEDLFSRWSFIDIVGQRPDLPKKPDPSAALAILEGAGASPDRSILVGDTRTDIETAVAGGLFPVGVVWGYRDREELLSAGARAILESPADLLELL